MKKLMFTLALICSSPAMAQTPGSGLFPAPASNEFGPYPYIDDSLTFADHLVGVPTHTDNDGASTDIRGAFRFRCAPGQVLADDPVVYPRKPGRSHIHQFYGAFGANAFSTYATLRSSATGSSTGCQNGLNNSGYWMPAMLVPDGTTGRYKVQRPEFIDIYYKRFPKNSPQCTSGNPAYAGQCVGIPTNLNMIFAYDMFSGTVPTGFALFKCVAPNGTNRAEFNSDMVATAATCQNDDELVLFIESPQCWNGVDLDTPNHRSHTANFVSSGGYEKCPDTHPKLMPAFTLQAHYKVTASLNKTGQWVAGQSTWRLSSDVMFGMPEKRPGSTFHADYKEGWNEYAKKAWTDNCIDRFLTCVAGDLGNGYALKQEWLLTNTASNPGDRIVNLPAGMTGPFLRNKVHATQ